MKDVVVVGANFAGSTAALEIKRRLKGKVDVTVIDSYDHSLYFPSLIWVPIGRREISDCFDDKTFCETVLVCSQEIPASIKNTTASLKIGDLK